mmetsp:Transcript_1081/g.4283  ORF Transcript_1081/g.4283 Transcript_1081/m.4283 type:complete len:235 (+) Transcript_1081:1452-2156(+)
MRAERCAKCSSLPLLPSWRICLTIYGSRSARSSLKPGSRRAISCAQRSRAQASTRRPSRKRVQRQKSTRAISQRSSFAAHLSPRRRLCATASPLAFTATSAACPAPGAPQTTSPVLPRRRAARRRRLSRSWLSCASIRAQLARSRRKQLPAPPPHLPEARLGRARGWRGRVWMRRWYSCSLPRAGRRGNASTRTPQRRCRRRWQRRRRAAAPQACQRGLSWPCLCSAGTSCGLC